MKSLKKFFALCLTLALVLSLAACAQKPAETTDPAETPDTPAQETEAPVTARIAALKGPTAMGLVKLMSDAPSSANGPLYDFTLAGSADEVTPALIKGELDMACVPANLAAVLYGKTDGALEVLAVIAYYQPVTRAYVDQIRGVDSAYTVGLLLERELIEECGRLAVPGRPILYRTTKNFLRSFGLSSLEELPELPDASQESGQLTLELEAAVARLRAEESGQTVQEDGAAHPAQEETE